MSNTELSGNGDLCRAYGPAGSLYFGGDTGYCGGVFAKIGARFGAHRGQLCEACSGSTGGGGNQDGGNSTSGGCGHGGLDVAAIPIGAYGTPSERWFHKGSHMDPGASYMLVVGGLQLV